MSIRDTKVIASAKFKKMFTPDFWLAFQNKSDARHIEHYIDEIKKEIEKTLLEDISKGDSESFEIDCKKTFKTIDEFIVTLAEIENNNSLLELDEEERFEDIDKEFQELKAFLAKKRIQSKELDDAMKGIETYRAKLRKVATEQTKLAYNVAHDHESFLRFVHLRGVHSIANHLKVVERHIKSERRGEVKDHGESISDIEAMMKADSMKAFEARKEDFIKHLRRYVGEAEKEFEDLFEANRMVALLINYVIDLLSKIERIVADAANKGYDSVKVEDFKKALEEEHKRQHEENDTWLNKCRAIAHRLGVRVA